ncbi:alpha-2-macroglobulin family protein [Pelomonas sp. P7]|uniref:Alpha-2-macroglobulin family protein n=1 Tax=Pelomonas caseinilytica TaxID=2906763 RepID=A0ABS8XS99_9BURK|nr:alpha-2-macroglobulin [Pelomonas sp. P7]MCE4540090.1 alpha-2-macroglobulin family protein [Pelomonas sp. P7]
MASRIVKAALAAVVVAGAAAAGWWGWQRSQQPSQPSSAEIGAEEAAFAFSECKARLFDGSPAIALMFTQALDRKQDFNALLTAAEGTPGPKADPNDPASKAGPPDPASFKPVAGRWVLGDNPRVLYLPYVTPDRAYRIAMKAELASHAGNKLATAQTCDAASEAMPPSFYFASRGLVLPAGQNGGLPVVSINTPEVDVQFLRVKPESLPAFLEQVGGRRERENRGSADEEGDYYDGGYGGYGDNQRRLKGTVGGWVLDELRAMTDSVYITRFKTDERPNRRNVSFLPVEKIQALQEPGIYVAVMSQPGRFGWDYQVTHYYVTDIGLHLRRHAAQIDVFTTSLKSGKAQGGIELSLIDEAGKALAQVQTDGDGHAVFTGRSDKARAVIARKGSEMSVLSLRDAALDLSEFDATGHPSRSSKLFVYAGRDLYRPGESFNVSVLSRDVDGRLPAKLLPVTLTVKKPDGSKLVEQLVQPAQGATGRPELLEPPRGAGQAKPGPGGQHALGQGYFQQSIALPADAPTGGWTVQARVDPAAKQPDAQWAFKVEEFLPERMKLTLTAPEAPLTGEVSLPVQVQGDYLYGAPAAGNRLQATVTTERLANPLAQKLPGFLFGDFADDKARSRQDVADVELDAEGKAEVALTANLAERSSPMRVRGAFSLLESGGRPVVRSLERTWWPAAALVGVRPLFDRNVAPEGGLAGFEVVRVDPTGAFKPAKDLKLTLTYEERQWYWRYDDGRGWHSGFNTTDELVEARSLKLAAKTTVNLPVRWGRYRLEIEDPETQETLRYAFYAGYGAQDADDIGNRPDRVQLQLKGAPFKGGDTAHLTIKPPHDGEAVVTVEGDRVLWSRRIGVKASGTDLDIPVSADPAWQRQDLYVTVAAFRPGSEGDRVTPARALGLVHLPLNREDRKLKVALEAPAKTQPSTTLPIRVKVPQLAGKAAIVTVSAVDVGILNITNYKTPDPADFFFGKHRYGADILDLYGRLIEKMEGNTAQQRFGGDAGKRDTQSMPRKVLLVDLFSGPVALDAKGEASISLKLPDFNGTLRLMAVVSSADSYGSTQADTVVAAPLVAELSMPRFIAPGDKATIALDVTNLSGAPQDVKVALSASGPVRISGAADAVRLNDKQRQILRFQAEALDAYGLAPIKLTVSAGPLSLVREAALQVQPVTPLTRESRRIRLEPGATQAVDKALLDAYWAGSAALSLSVSNTPPIDIREQVRGLLMYPYGCLEQTTSSAYPLVFIDDEAAKRWGLTPVPREERAKRLEGAFARLAGMQQARGGYGLWAASSPYEAWLSAYVTGFLQDARDAGFAVPEVQLKKSLDNLTEQFQRSPGQQMTPPKEPRRNDKGQLADYHDAEALRMAHQRFAEAAHMGYILAREQKAPLATLRTLHDQHRGNALSPLPLVHLSLALKLMGDEARAKVALDDAMKRGYGYQQPDPNNYWWGEWLGDYGSRVRDRALAYALLLRHKVVHERRENLLFDLADDFSRRNYYSTQERLALFLAMQAATNGAGKDDAWKTTLAIGAKSDAWNGSGTGQQSLDLAQLKAGVTLKNEGTAPLYLDVTAQGYPVKPLPPSSERIAVERAMFTTEGKPVSARQFTTGEMFIVRLRVKATQLVKDGLVVDRIPAGFEIENLNLSQGPQAGEFTVEGVNVAQANANERIVHTEYRDDRFVAAAQLGSQLDLFYLVRVVTPGRFVVPATFAEDMYRPEIRGVGRAEGEITVVDKK